MLHSYFRQRHSANLQQYAEVIKQFSLHDITSLLPDAAQAAVLTTLMQNGAFSYKGPVPRADLPTYCVIAFPPAVRFHLGYASVLKEAVTWIKAGAKPIILLSACETLVRGADPAALREKIAYSRSFLHEYFLPYAVPQILVDMEVREFGEFELEVQSKINIAKLHQLMGDPAEGESVSYYRIPALMVTTFLLAQKLVTEKVANFIVPVGMNEMTYAELAKQVAKRLGMHEPTFVFRAQINDLGGQVRMSSKTPKKALHMGEDTALVSSKLKAAVTNPQQPAPGHEDHARPMNCHFLRLVAEIVPTASTFASAYNNCIRGYGCKNCKEDVTQKISESGL